MPTVYMDDISLSSDDLAALQSSFDELVHHLTDGAFEISPDKTRKPGPAMDLFNCDLTCGQTNVRPDRIDKFLSEPHSENSVFAFNRYCASVEAGNA